MRPSPILPALAAVLLAAVLLAAPPLGPGPGLAADAGARARPARRRAPHSAKTPSAKTPSAKALSAKPHSDMDETLARRAEADRLRGRPDWDPPRPLASYLPPATRERMAAPPFTGWGYGAPVPGAWPGF